MNETVVSSFVGLSISRLNVTAGTDEARGSRGLNAECAYKDILMSLNCWSSVNETMRKLGVGILEN